MVSISLFLVDSEDKAKWEEILALNGKCYIQKKMDEFTKKDGKKDGSNS